MQGLDQQSEESEIHFSQVCAQFRNERKGETLNFEDVFSSLDVQISFIKKFKIVARKWKLLLEIETSTIQMDPPAPDSVMRLMELQFVICSNCNLLELDNYITLHYIISRVIGKSQITHKRERSTLCIIKRLQVDIIMALIISQMDPS